MKSKTIHNLIISLILTIGHPTSVTAVSDAELEALEKQIEQLEAEEMRKTEAKVKEKLLLARLPEDEVIKMAQKARLTDRSQLGRLEKSADLGNKYAQSELGLIYQIERKYHEALELLEKSATKGVASAQYRLGYTYATGYGGLGIDKSKAIELYKKAAAQGNEFAIQNLKALGIRSGW